MDCNRVKGFSALVTRYPMIDLESFLASRKSKIFLAMRGLTAVSFKPSKQKGHIPIWQPRDISFGQAAAPKKWSFFQTKKSVGVKIKHFLPFETTNRG
jgi:hypothetical protein